MVHMIINIRTMLSNLPTSLSLSPLKTTAIRHSKQKWPRHSETSLEKCFPGQILLSWRGERDCHHHKSFKERSFSRDPTRSADWIAIVLEMYYPFWYLWWHNAIHPHPDIHDVHWFCVLCIYNLQRIISSKAIGLVSTVHAVAWPQPKFFYREEGWQ